MSDSATATQPRNIALRVRDRDGALQLLPETHRSCDPLHYPTLFPAGDDGWHLDLLKQSLGRQRRRPSTDGAQRPQDANADEDSAVHAFEGSQRLEAPSQFVENEASESAHRQALRRVTAREYYAYRLQERAMSPDILFRAQRLFQEFCCFSWVKTETTKLNYLRYNQNQLELSCTRTYVTTSLQVMHVLQVASGFLSSCPQRSLAPQRFACEISGSYGCCSQAWQAGSVHHVHLQS